LIEVFIMKLFLLLSLIIFANSSLAKREFCLYGYEGITRVVDPYYTDSNNETVYYETIEEYAKFAGPTWFGVSMCGNNTVVNNVGRYFKYTGNSDKDEIFDKDKISEENTTEENVTDSISNDDKDEVVIINKRNSLNEPKVKKFKNFVKRDNNENVLNLNTKEEFTEYYNNLYKKLIDLEKTLKCIPLTSVNPAYNPYHNSLIIGNKDVNIITNVGRSIGGGDKKSTFDNLVKDKNGNYNIEQCGLVYNMKGATISCS
ncbi:hypothetical protein BCR36DRAFT_251888, partial [Piromyces finnis]